MTAIGKLEIPGRPWGANLGMLVAVTSWGTLIPTLNYLLKQWDPYFLALARYAVGVPIMLVFLRIREGPGPWMARLASWRWWVLGTIGIGILAPLYSVGLQHASPITAAILNSATPAIAAIVGWLFYRIPITRLMILCIILTIAGCLIATYDPSSAGSPFDLRGGEVLIVAAGACWCWYSITSQRWVRGCSQLRISAMTTATGSVGLLLIYLAASAWGAGDFPPRAPGGSTHVLVFLWLSLVPILLGNLLWLNAVSKIGLVLSALYMNLVPTTTVVISAALGNPPTSAQLIGGSIVLAGIMLAQLPHKWVSPVFRNRRGCSQ